MVVTSTVSFSSNGGDAGGFLAVPDGEASSPGVIVIQEWWGLNAHIQDVTARVAEAGYVALAPDLYHGRVATEPDEARKAAMELDTGRALRDIGGAIAYLQSLDRVEPKRVGVIGFCMGGGLALRAGAQNPHVAAVVAFYGAGPDAKEITNTSVAILNIVGEKDERILSAARSLEVGLRGTPIQHDLVVYPGVGHAFFNDTRPGVYEPSAAHDAWARTIQWLRTHLV